MFALTVLTSGPGAAPVLEPTSTSGRVEPVDPDNTGRPPRYRLEWPEPPLDLVRLRLGDEVVSFWADEVSRECPVLLSTPRVAVCPVAEDRDYLEVVESVRQRGGRSALTEIAVRDEDGYEAAARRNRQLRSPTWLGLGRDLRTFGFSLHGVGAGQHAERVWDWIAPQWHGEGVPLPGSGTSAVRYHFLVGRGIGPQDAARRRLSEGVLPILEATVDDGAIRYELQAFVTLERTPLSRQANAGRHYLHADGHSVGHMFTAEQQAEFDAREARPGPDEETVLFLRVRATNRGRASRHGFLTLPAPYAADQREPLPYRYDPRTGSSRLDQDRVFCVSSTRGGAPGQEELSFLLQPGETRDVDVRLPHRPVSGERAAALAARDWDEALQQCRTYWRAALGEAASVALPERRLNEMVSAGLLHLDLVAYGEEPAGALAPTIGVYAPIGSESAPIIQFFDSMGRPDLASRSLQYFFDKQHADGFMQNFGGYMLETEAVLWSVGEHYRYTRDDAWVRQILPGLDAAVGYVLRNRHAQQQARTPHGLVVGKTADPEDPYAAFMLNGYACLGLSRAAETVAALDPDRSSRWAAEAEALRDDVRAAFQEAVAGSPLVPLGDGRWVRTAPPWAAQAGPLALDRSNQRWFTHGAATARDTLLGPLWLAFQEVLDPDERLTSDLLDYHADLFFHDNTAFSQPYYSPHPLVHLRRGEVKAFLTAYYTMVASLADPETYSFWEHYFHASPHKTHEEAWFLMQTRWMLYLERGDELQILPGVPRRWLAAEQRVRLAGVRSYFGPVDVDVQVSADGDVITADVTCEAARTPRTLSIRLPHPSGRSAVSTSAGSYDPKRETVRVAPADGCARVELRF